MLLVILPVIDERVEYVKANIVPSVLVLRSWVSKSNNEQAIMTVYLVGSGSGLAFQ